MHHIFVFSQEIVCVTHRDRQWAGGLPTSCRRPRLSQMTHPFGWDGLKSPFTDLPYGRNSEEGHKDGESFKKKKGLAGTV